MTVLRKRIILELGSGIDLHGGDYTKAAVRAVEDAIRHSSLSIIGTLELDPRNLLIEVTIAVQQTGKVDPELVKAVLPYGEIGVYVVKGGLDVPDEATGDTVVIACAAVAVRADIEQPEG